MESLIALLEHLNNLERLLDAGLLDCHLLETAHQPLVTHNVTVILLIGSGTDETHLAALEIRF